MDFDSRTPISRESTSLYPLLNQNGSYPERPGEPDCSYYIRTGLCRFGSTCRFNHPHDRKLVIATARVKGEYPERIGQPDCELIVCLCLRTAFVANPPPSSFTSLVLPQSGVVPIQGWNASGLGLLSPSGSDQNYRYQQQDDAKESSGSQGGFFSSGFHSGNSVPLGVYALPREDVFPERPGLPECQFYMKTGDCKFGTVCKFHHPRDRQTPGPDCVLSPIGRPLRPGEPLCEFYSWYGICKYGPSCKFDHPMRVFTYNNNASPPSSSLHQETTTTITTQLRNLIVSSS